MTVKPAAENKTNHSPSLSWVVRARLHLLEACCELLCVGEDAPALGSLRWAGTAVTVNVCRLRRCAVELWSYCSHS